jgi:hypothetical protein
MAQKYDEQGESRYGYTPVKQGNYWGIIDSTGRLITPIQYQTAQIINLNCNQAALLLDDRYCFIAPDTMRCYQKVYDFVDGYAKACNGFLCGYIDSQGKEIVPIQYQIFPDNQWRGLSKISYEGFYGYLQTSPPKIILQPNYEALKLYKKDMLLAKNKTARQGLFDSMGNEILSTPRWGLLDSMGNQILPFEYSDISEWGEDSLLLAKMQDYKKTIWLFVLNSSQMPKYLGNASGGLPYQIYTPLYALEINGKCGAYNNKLAVTIPFIYDNIYRNYEHYIAKLGDFIEVYDPKGQKVFSQKDSITHLSIGGELHANYGHIIAHRPNNFWILDNKLKIINKSKLKNCLRITGTRMLYEVGNKVGLLDVNGNILTPPKYDQIYDDINSDIDTTLLFYYSKSTKKKGLLSPNGQELSLPIYDTIIMANNYYMATIVSEKSDTNVVFDSKGKLLYKGSQITPRTLIRRDVWQRYWRTEGNFLIETVFKNQRSYQGLLSGEGKRILACEYKTVIPSTNNYHIVSKYLSDTDQQTSADSTQTSLFGIVDNENRLRLPMQYDTIYFFPANKGWIVQTAQGKQLLDSTFKTVTTHYYDYIRFNRYHNPIVCDTPILDVQQNGLKGIIDINDNEIIPPIVDCDHIIITSNQKKSYYTINKGGSSTCFCGTDKVCPIYGGGWGIIDSTGKTIIQARYEGSIERKGDKWLVTNSYKVVAVFALDGTLMVEGEAIKLFTNQLAFAVQKNQKWAIIDATGKALTDYEFDKVEVTEDRKNAIVSRNDKWGIIRYDGKWVMDLNCAEIVYPYAENKVFAPYGEEVYLYKLEKGIGICEPTATNLNKWGIIFANTPVVIPAQYQQIRFEKTTWWLATKDNLHWGFLNTAGEESTDFIYSDPQIIVLENNSYFIVKDTSGFYGLIDSTQNVIVPFVHSNIYSEHNKYICAIKGNTLNLYNTKGKLIWSINDIAATKPYLSFYNSIIAKYDLQNTHFYDEITQKLVQLQLPESYNNYKFDYFLTYYDFAILYVDKKMGLVNRQGKIVLQPIYKDINVLTDEQQIKAFTETDTYLFNYNGTLLTKHPNSQH